MKNDCQAPTDDTSNNAYLDDILQVRMQRRQLLQGSLNVAAATLFSSVPLSVLGNTPTSTPTSKLGFTSIPVSTEDTVIVPSGYKAEVLFAWGDPISDGATFDSSAKQSAAEQALQAGMHHDGMHYFPLPLSSDNAEQGLLVINHEYIDAAILHPDGQAQYTQEKSDKEMAAHGVSVIEVKKTAGQWSLVRPSQYARRITAQTPMQLSGPVAGNELVKTAADPEGTQVLGTLNNCANGYTPWGTYLTCEENFHTYFKATDSENSLQKRYGLKPKSRYGWEQFHPRFNAQAHPNEPNRFGWIVEIDPFNPSSPPIKRTALGRFSHENAALAIADDNRVVIYSGDDARFEYIYKFVSAEPYNPDNRAANMDLLDTGTLYAAKFNADGTGEWLPLVHGERGLTAENGFADQAAVLVKTRLAADTLGATKMDRPEWIAVHPDTQQVYATLTNNSHRGKDGKPSADTANPRDKNIFGHIIRWDEQNNDPTATTFAWDIYALCGDPANEASERQGTVQGDIYACPDGLWVDLQGLLWIQTDVSSRKIGKGDYEPFGNNQMLAADPVTGETRRFLTGPKGCEITGIAATPDGKTLFINIQHPGESGTSASNPTGLSDWPDGPNGQRPRSATVVIQKEDGNLIGS